jgi:hypothetical protein
MCVGYFGAGGGALFFYKNPVIRYVMESVVCATIILSCYMALLFMDLFTNLFLSLWRKDKKKCNPVHFSAVLDKVVAT